MYPSIGHGLTNKYVFFLDGVHSSKRDPTHAFSRLVGLYLAESALKRTNEAMDGVVNYLRLELTR